MIDSRLAGGGEQIRRRRECLQCRERFTTYESAELNFPRIIKSDGRREAFSEGKLRAGILRALEKRPIGMDSVDLAVASVMRKLRASGESELGAAQVGEWVMEELRDLDQVAYVRFASVYRSFEDVRAFQEEIERLKQELPPELKQSQLDLLTSDSDER